MKIIKEELLLKPEEITELNKLKGRDYAQGQIDKLKQIFKSKYDSIINTSDQDTNILHEVLNSINNYGWDTNNNKTLSFVEKMNKPLPREGFKAISQSLQSGVIRLENNTDWILEKDSYSPTFKVKALAFLSSDKATQFGDNPKSAKEQVKRMNDENQIKAFLSNWQTKNGEASKGTILDLLRNNPQELSINPSKIPAESIEYSKSISTSDDLLDQKGKALIKSLLTSLDLKGNYSSIIDNLTKFETEIKETLNEDSEAAKNLDKLNIKDQYWSKKYRSLLRLLNQPSNSVKNSREILLDFLDDIDDELEAKYKEYSKTKGDKDTQDEQPKTTQSKGNSAADRRIANAAKPFSGWQMTRELILGKPNSKWSDSSTDTGTELIKYIKRDSVYRDLADFQQDKIDDWLGSGELNYILDKRRYNDVKEFEKFLDDTIIKRANGILNKNYSNW